jgi:hypothetical protein
MQPIEITLFQSTEILNLQKLDLHNKINILYIAQYNKYTILKFLLSTSDVKAKFFNIKHNALGLKIPIIFVSKFL